MIIIAGRTVTFGPLGSLALKMPIELYSNPHEVKPPTGEPDAGYPPVRFGGSCALQAHEIQSPEMATIVKPSQRLCTESCVVLGNGHCEA